MSRLRGPPGAGRMVATGFVLLLVALLMARLLVQGAWGWTAFALALPVILLALGLWIGWIPALLGTAFFACAVLVFRVLVTSTAGWVVVALLPVVAFSLMLGVRVVRRLRDGRP